MGRTETSNDERPAAGELTCMSELEPDLTIGASYLDLDARKTVTSRYYSDGQGHGAYFVEK